MSKYPKKCKLLSVLLVDDHRILVDILRRQLESDGAFKVVGSASNPDDAITLLGQTRADVVLLDIDMKGQSGLDAIAPLRAIQPGVRIVMLSMYDQELFRSQSFELGADAFVTKGARFEDLRAVILDEPATSLSEAPMIWRRPSSGHCAHCTLTAREIQVIRSLAAGQREKEVAEELGISVSSVGTYLKRAMAKMGVGTRAELMKQAGALGSAQAGAVRL